MVNTIASYPEVEAILQTLLEGLRSILGEKLTGLYIHGSLAYGNFDPRTSDIDFLVVTKDQLANNTFFALKEMHSRIFKSRLPWSQKLEGAYIPIAYLRRHDPTHPPVPWLGVDGHFALEKLGNDWVLQRWILREKGLAISGPPLTEMIEAVGPEDLQKAVRGSFREWWSPPFPSPERFEDSSYQAYAVLTMCRSLYVLKHGRIASKPEAALWAIEAYPEWSRQIQNAFTGQGVKPPLSLEDVFQFIHFTLQESGLRKGQPEKE